MIERESGEKVGCLVEGRGQVKGKRLIKAQSRGP